MEPFNGYLWVGGHIVDLAFPFTNMYLYDEQRDTMLFAKPNYAGFDEPVRCMTQYKDELYIGGDFNFLQGTNGALTQTFNHICKVKLYCEESPVGINDNFGWRNEDFELYPNPTGGKLVIENAKEEIGLFDLMGQKIMTQKVVADKTEVDVSFFATGIYFVKSRNGAKKFIKE